MSIALFNAVPAGAIETLYDDEDQPWFKRSDVGRYLKIADIGRNFKELNGDIRTRQEILGPGGALPQLGMRGGGKNPHVFLSIDAAIEVEVKSKKPKAVELTKWLAKKGVDKIIEEKQQAIEQKGQYSGVAQR